MPYRARKPQRKRGYDYRNGGLYFVTICIHQRLPLLGHVHHNLMCWNMAGSMIARFWDALPIRFSTVTIDSYVVMPNHTHAIVGLQDMPDSNLSLSDVIGWFKTMTTNAYIQGVKDEHWTAFAGKFWQRSFHDHIIRSEPEYNQIRQYVLTNPARWQTDKFHQL